MMEKIKKSVAFILVVLLISALLSPCASALQGEQIPIVDMRGFMSYTIYEDKDDPNSNAAFPPSTSKILSTVKELAPALVSLSFSGDWNKFGDRLISSVNELMFPLGFDENGEAMYNTGVHFTYPTKEEVESTLTTEFVYDWRADPFESAAKLNDFVLYLTEELGFEKVALECHSYGGIVMLTYLEQYGTSHIHSCCFNASAVYGASFAGQLVKGNIDLSDSAVTEFLKSLFSHNDAELILDSILDALYDAGITASLSDFVNKIFAMLSERIWVELILPVFGNWPSIWALVPDEDYSEGYSFVFDNIYPYTGKDYSALKEKLERYNTVIRADRESCLKRVNGTTSMYIIARYGYYGVPLGNIWMANTDTVLNTSAESFGAKCKPAYFSSASNGDRFVSPNGAIDASGCLFPEQTWFIRNCKHAQKEESIKHFTAALLRCEGQATVDTFPDYPQFLYFRASDSELMPDKNSLSDYRDTFANRFWRYLVKAIQWLRSLFPNFYNNKAVI